MNREKKKESLVFLLQTANKIFGEKKSIELLYKLIFCSFAIVGASLDLTKVIDLSDSSLFLMAIPNIIGVYILAGIVKKEFHEYSQKYMK